MKELVAKAAEIRNTIETKTCLKPDSFGCGHRDGKLMVMLPNRHVKSPPQHAEITHDDDGQVTRIYSANASVLADVAVTTINGRQ